MMKMERVKKKMKKKMNLGLIWFLGSGHKQSGQKTFYFLKILCVKANKPIFQPQKNSRIYHQAKWYDI